MKPKPAIEYKVFEQVDLRAGTIVKVAPFPRARKPAFKVWADFGPDVGVLQTSAQITALYSPQTLLGKQIIGCINLGEKNIGGFLSQFLLVGFSAQEGGICLATTMGTVPNGQHLH